MHIPDGFLSFNTWAPAWVLSVGLIGYCIRRTAQKLKEKTIPLMGVTAAFIFAAQMLNFPVAGGTSGHLLGGVLAAVLLGPWAGAVILTVVLIVQCLVFQDGGITALGANIFNMAILGVMSGYIIYKVFRNKFSIVIASAVAGWFSVVIASCACAIELVLSGTSPFKIVFPAMVGIHIIIGIGEGIITGLILGFISKVRPDLIYPHTNFFQKVGVGV